MHVTVLASWHRGRNEPDLAGCGRYCAVLCRWPWPAASLLPSRLLAGRRGCCHAWPCLDAAVLHCSVSWRHALQLVPCHVRTLALAMACSTPRPSAMQCLWTIAATVAPWLPGPATLLATSPCLTVPLGVRHCRCVMAV